MGPGHTALDSLPIPRLDHPSHQPLTPWASVLSRYQKPPPCQLPPLSCPHPPTYPALSSCPLRPFQSPNLIRFLLGLKPAMASHVQRKSKLCAACRSRPSPFGVSPVKTAPPSQVQSPLLCSHTPCAPSSSPAGVTRRGPSRSGLKPPPPHPVAWVALVPTNVLHTPPHPSALSSPPSPHLAPGSA